MAQKSVDRSKYWWLWPNFYSEKDARDGAKMGVIASGLIMAVTGVVFVYRYASDGDVFGLVGGLVVSVVWCFLGYGMFFRMSRVSALIALLLFLADKLYTVGIEGKPLGIATILVLYLVNANRAIFWFRRKGGIEDAKASKIITCENCGTNQNPSDYNQETPTWLCSNCGKELFGQG